MRADLKYKVTELPPCHCEAQGGWCEPRNEAIAGYTGRTCIVRDCFTQTKGVILKHSKQGAMGFSVFVILFCSFLSITALAQNSEVTNKDTSKKIVIMDAKPVGKHIKILYDVDGKLYYTESLKKGLFNPAKVFYVKVLKPNEAKMKYGENAKNGVIVIITNKEFAVKSYETKFCSFSKKYESYILNNNDNDKDLEYVLDGKELDDSEYNKIIKLYDLSAQKIAMVDLTKNPEHNGYQGKKGIVVINTKQ
jgi:hypothetical protein